ncbi:Serine-threonine/tyrosine-protein kinase, catalytic domain [Sesbania bispinosa]|nr:Serine-threonine/tyrosine-protein kinase, catalytic domain [Sesbania bispinosa]
MSDNSNATDVDQFNEMLRNLLESLASNASSGDSLHKFATGNVRSEFQTIFGLVQCTPDLSELDLNACLIGAILEIPQCCDSKKGGRILRPSCNFRYETYPFYDSTNIIIAAPPTGSALRPSSTQGENGDEIRPTETWQLDFATIMAATNNFSHARKLGQGGFGSVYKGKLFDGQEVAVKRLSRNSMQGDTEFKNEAVLVAKLQHRNLVRLLGFCLERKERLLVYEFVSNKSLDFFIFGKSKLNFLVDIGLYICYFKLLHS